MKCDPNTHMVNGNADCNRTTTKNKKTCANVQVKPFSPPTDRQTDDGQFKCFTCPVLDDPKLLVLACPMRVLFLVFLFGSSFFYLIGHCVQVPSVDTRVF